MTNTPARLFRNWFRPGPRRPAPPRALPSVEALERRLVPAVIVREIGEFNGAGFGQGDAYPRPAVSVGTFEFDADLGSGRVKSATVSGTFGNSTIGHTSGVDLFLDGILVGRAEPYGDAWYHGGTWTHTLTGAELDVLQDGTAELTAVQTNEYVIRLGGTRLEMDAAALEIVGLNRTTFVATDEIVVRAEVGAPGVRVQWTVQGQQAASGVRGFPTGEATTSDADGIATFRFRPSDNPTFVANRHQTWTRGSRTANPPVAFEVIARAAVDGEVREARLSQTDLGPLVQDETDRLRQEYYDYGIPVPGRGQVVASLGAGFNQGNYGVQLSNGLAVRYQAIVAAYRGLAVTVTIDGRAYRTAIPETAGVGITSGYRNPQRNRAVGSVHADSQHTRGRALDLVPGPVTVTIPVNGRPRRVALPLHAVLYRALYAAARTQGTAIAEQGATPVPVGDPRENHIHVQW